MRSDGCSGSVAARQSHEHPPEDTGPPGQNDPVSKLTRDRIVDLLGEHFAHDHLTLEDFERRLNLALESDSRQTLGFLVVDLPAVVLPTAPSAAEPSAALRPLSHPAQIKDEERLSAIFGEARRVGRWTPARETTISVAMGVSSPGSARGSARAGRVRVCNTGVFRIGRSYRATGACGRLRWVGRVWGVRPKARHAAADGPRLTHHPSRGLVSVRLGRGGDSASGGIQARCAPPPTT